MLTIRFARGDDLLTLPEIERQAGEAFRSLGMDSVADDEPLPVQRLADYQQPNADSTRGHALPCASS